MASPQSSAKLFSNYKITMHDVDADYSTAAVVTATEVDMSVCNGVGYVIMTSALTGAGPTLVEIVGYTTSGGTGTVTQIKTSGTVAADAVGDYVALECTAAELRQEAEDAGAELRYVALRLTNANAQDECVATVIQDQIYKGASETATTIS